MQEKDKKLAPLGRPLKGKDRRIQIGAYISTSVVDMIDEYVNDRQIESRTQYSRSDFINEAIEKHMRDLGLIKEDDGEQKQG